MPLFTALTTQKHARSARTWLVRNPAAAQLLTEITQGTKPLDHTAFTDHPSARKVAFLRELFVEHGLIEPFNKDIETYEDWLEGKLADAPAGIAAMIRLYGRWTHLNRMHPLARTHQTRTGTLLSAKQSTTVAVEFLEFLTSRNVSPGQCRQQGIDDWLPSGPTTRALARSFVRLAIGHHHLPKDSSDLWPKKDDESQPPRNSHSLTLGATYLGRTALVARCSAVTTRHNRGYWHFRAFCAYVHFSSIRLKLGHE